VKPGSRGPGSRDPAQGDPAQGDPAQGDPAQGDPAQGDPAQGDPAQGDPAQGDPGSGGPGSRGPGSRGPGSGGPGSRGPGSRGPGSKGTRLKGTRLSRRASGDLQSGDLQWGTLSGGPSGVGDLQWGTFSGGPSVGDLQWGTFSGDLQWGPSVGDLTTARLHCPTQRRDGRSWLWMSSSELGRSCRGGLRPPVPELQVQSGTRHAGAVAATRRQPRADTRTQTGPYCLWEAYPHGRVRFPSGASAIPTRCFSGGETAPHQVACLVGNQSEGGRVRAYALADWTQRRWRWRCFGIKQKDNELGVDGQPPWRRVRSVLFTTTENGREAECQVQTLLERWSLPWPASARKSRSALLATHQQFGFCFSEAQVMVRP